MDTDSRKGKYVARATSISKQKGFRLSLSKMADKMGIIKKTLYSNFSSRDGLLKECVCAVSGDLQSVLSILEEDTGNPIGSLTKCFAQLDELLVTLSPVSFSDLMWSSPDQTILEHLMGSRHPEKTVTVNLQRGVQRDLYRLDLDIPFIHEYVSYLIFGFYIQAVIRNQLLPTGSYFASILQYHLRAIVSTEGSHLI